jgi:hypothetical protein
MNKALEILFGSPYRVKIIRLFLFNTTTYFTLADVQKRSQVPVRVVKREIKLLKDAHFLHEKKIKEGKKIQKEWGLNEDFHLKDALTNLLESDAALMKRSLFGRLKSVGRIKLIIVSGVFLGRNDSRADLLIVGDSLRTGKIEALLRKIEADIGRELVYALYENDEFGYRLSAYDKFIRDVLDYPHEKLVNKLNLP